MKLHICPNLLISLRAPDYYRRACCSTYLSAEERSSFLVELSVCLWQSIFPLVLFPGWLSRSLLELESSPSLFGSTYPGKDPKFNLSSEWSLLSSHGKSGLNAIGGDSRIRYSHLIKSLGKWSTGSRSALVLSRWRLCRATGWFWISCAFNRYLVAPGKSFLLNGCDPYKES